MRRVELTATIRSTPPESVFDEILQFDRYPQLAPHVESTNVHLTVPGPLGQSSWELHFRSGLLRWVETEHFRKDLLRIDFEQVEGDFDSFAGFWQLRPAGGGTELHFQADFDFGIPSLEGILDPIAERVIKETVAWVVVGMFDDVHLDEQIDIAPSPSTTVR